MENLNNPPENTPPQPVQQPGNIPYNKPEAPNSTLVLVLGILSIPSSFCCCMGMLVGIIALVVHKQSMATYNQNPDAYRDPQSLRIGKICAIVGLVLGGLSIVVNIVYYVIMAGASGLELFQNF